MSDLDFCEFPTCPHCGNEELNWLELMDETIGDGDEVEFECGSCGGTVTVEVHITYRFTTVK
mgnify:CR=1 FL=1